MVTHRKLVRQRAALEAERQADADLDSDPTTRPRWQRHQRHMDEMLVGVDPARFEALARGESYDVR